jgi:hypothetical protein
MMRALNLNVDVSMHIMHNLQSDSPHRDRV